MKPYLSVTSELIESFEKIVQSGLRGTHLLFSNQMIREAFTREKPVELLADQDVAKQVQSALADLLDRESLEERQEYIEGLERNIRDVLVHLYFGFLDKYISEDEESPEVLH
jgi:L-rhamnose isomerase